MRIGLIGVGRIGAMHAANLRDLPGIDDLYIADADVELARASADKLGVSSAGSVQELLASKPDGVVIAAPTNTHADLVAAVAQAGVAVFCEKPLAIDVPGTRAAVTRVAATGTPLQMGFQRRFDPGYRTARERLRSGELGWLHSILACTLDSEPPPASYIPGSGGIFRDCSVHDFDAIRWLTGAEVVEVRAVGANRGASFFTEAGDVDTGQALLTLGDGTLVTTVATRYNGGGHDVRTELHGSRGTAVIGLSDRTPMTSTERDVTWPSDSPYVGFADRFKEAYVAELRAFLEVAAGRAPSPCGGEDALEALYVAEACELSRRDGRPVRIEEVRG
ncbi:Gfo/Idh/MocA family protein [Actinopolymorpha pittospori]|uniref:Myo-inositol 2-dehydrogenase/D-chiro-inositol 1-dehydrogenase n=1 Tax=Actinopolymorpha pittospori TaxID=648752 RepID=A0A927RDD1_9ACTN|nr:Gfo/Idh/MocA family oxidoreductase [Actinopolymorpha pittospori]MBE1610894.1 myo-inositol 2-dehydrogenase/D-chiro-inositol 1-dehydrogenase [Actinopolymorpha pittospori]